MKDGWLRAFGVPLYVPVEDILLLIIARFAKRCFSQVPVCLRQGFGLRVLLMPVTIPMSLGRRAERLRLGLRVLSQTRGSTLGNNS